MGSFFCCTLSSKTQSCDSVAAHVVNGDQGVRQEEKELLVSEKVTVNNFAAEESTTQTDEVQNAGSQSGVVPGNRCLSESGRGNPEPVLTNGIGDPSETDDIESESGDSIEESDVKETPVIDQVSAPMRKPMFYEPRPDVKLSASEMAELQDIFRMFDKDNSGSIDVTELESMVSSLGIVASKEDLNDMIAEADADHSGTIEFEEFKVLIGPHFQREKPPEDFIDAFKFFDKDGDGYISRSELRTIMNNVDNNLAEADIEEMIREADSNGDGKIDFDEFTKMMQNQQ